MLSRQKLFWLSPQSKLTRLKLPLVPEEATFIAARHSGMEKTWWRLKNRSVFQDRRVCGKREGGLSHAQPSKALLAQPGRARGGHLHSGAPLRHGEDVVALEKQRGQDGYLLQVAYGVQYLWFGMERLEELGLSVRLPKGSKILLAGGWKQHYAQEVDRFGLVTRPRRRRRW